MSPLLEVQELGQLEGDEVSLGLALRPFASDGIVVELEVEVVPVDAVKGVANDFFPFPIFLEEGFEFVLVAVGVVFHVGALAVCAGQLLVDVLEYGIELLDKYFPPVVDGLGHYGERVLEYIHQRRVVGKVGSQQGVALPEGILIADEPLEVIGVVLRDDGVDKPSPLFAAAGDQEGIGRRNHDKGDFPDVLRIFSVRFPVVAYLLPVASLQTAGDGDFAVQFVAVEALQHHEVRVVLYIIGVGRVE